MMEDLTATVNNDSILKSLAYNSLYKSLVPDIFQDLELFGFGDGFGKVIW